MTLPSLDRSTRAVAALVLAIGVGCARVQAPLTTAVPVAVAADADTPSRQTENTVMQQGYPRNDSAFVAPRIIAS